MKIADANVIASNVDWPPILLETYMNSPWEIQLASNDPEASARQQPCALWEGIWHKEGKIKKTLYIR